MNIFGIILSLILISFFGYYNLPITKKQYKILLISILIIIFLLIEWRLRKPTIENFADTEISVGPSTSNSKTVSLPNYVSSVSPIPQNLQDPGTNQTFSVKINGDKLIIKRTDRNLGWSQNLILKGILGAELGKQLVTIPDSEIVYPEIIPSEENIIIPEYATNFVFSLSKPYTIVKSEKNILITNNVFEKNSEKIERIELNSLFKESDWKRPLEINELFKSKLNPKDDRYDSATVYYNKLSYWAGGFNYHNKSEKLSDLITIYDESWGVWYNKKFLSEEKKTGVSVIAAQGLIIFAGGYKANNDTDPYSDKVEIYDTSLHYSDQNAWHIELLPSGGRCNIKIGVIKNKVLFYGGYGRHGISKFVDIYDIKETNYPWSKLVLPDTLCTINLHIISNNKENLLMTSKNYVNDIPIDKGLIIYMNERNLYNIENNVYNPYDQITHNKIYKDLTGTSIFIDDWFRLLYNRSLEINNFKPEYSMSIWINIFEFKDSVSWIIKNDNEAFPNIIIEKNLLYPIIKIQGKTYKQGNGFEINHGWNNITLTLGNKSYIYINNSRNEFSIDPEINLSMVSKGFQLNNLGDRIDIHSSTGWSKAVIASYKCYNRSLNRVQCHNNYMYENERYRSDILDEEDNNVSDFYKYYNDLETENLVYKCDGEIIKPINTNNMLSTKYLFNMSTSSNDKYGVVHCDELLSSSVRNYFKKYILIYDFDNKIWNIRLDEVSNIFILDNIVHNNTIILSGMQYNPVTRYFPKPTLYITKLPNTYVKPVFKDIFKKTNFKCEPGFKRGMEDCIKCPVNTYSEKNNSGNCTPCPLRFTTNGKVGQTKCVQDDAFFKLKREFEISPSTLRDIRKFNKDYKLQTRELDNKQKIITFLDKGLMTQINNLKNNNTE